MKFLRRESGESGISLHMHSTNKEGFHCIYPGGVFARYSLQPANPEMLPVGRVFSHESDVDILAHLIFRDLCSKCILT